MPKIVILGAGPCGLGAAWRLKELGFNDFLMVEATEYAGGLASSFVDERGFTWDIGGHIQFSHYEDFDRVMELALPGGWLQHERESWIWIRDRFVPYPFQNNLWRLPEDLRQRCLEGLEGKRSGDIKNFSDWIDHNFGEGIADLFMRPYNFKVWAYPPEKMSHEWLSERVATVDVERVKENIRLKRDDLSWGPNATFKFPKRGGTGAIWNAVADLIGREKIQFSTSASKIDTRSKTIELTGGRRLTYEKLLSTIPIDRLAQIVGIKLRGALLSSNSHIVGIGIEGQVPDHLKQKCWMYFPESNAAFYRVTVFSNYSPANVPDSTKHWSLMCETSSSPEKPVNEDRIIEDSLQGLLATKLLQPSDLVVSKWSKAARPGYPTPTPDRDSIVHAAFAELKKFDIDSRGRFGAWKYEVSNQDHTFMQGFEWADAYLRGTKELTVFHPDKANAPGKRPMAG